MYNQDFFTLILMENIYNIWLICLLFTCLLFLLCLIIPPQKIGRILPFFTAFWPSKNIQLDFQSVAYVALHRNIINRIIHYSIFVDAFAWLLILNSFWQGFLPIAVLLFMVQTFLIKEFKFTILANLILLTILAALLSLFDANIEYLMLWTMLSAALRVIGHFFEPLPPFLIDNSGQFAPMNFTTLKKLGLIKIVALLPIGFLAEFLSGQANRLFLVQINAITSALYKHQHILVWKNVVTKGINSYKKGIKQEPLFKSYCRFFEK
ncbi:hypothetical protein THERMOT_1431 [Bathymodiolus thermophilus thioautotrophic gill symbiont]|uniref:hypothetical protein n=1 Tax=Bathymodiolus thermophilus thioautotrophic gill symbiont TaxID=2360 RepID=UPI001160A48E|nr:hypothetical protein [Bathymodiolus thermophilus thioautotrophic gill symbiont]CAB5501504.1 hypothetical protein THERMOT_1431 [Bathymodiolus thermophilus thioautotrophic gill symbiont]